MKTLVSVPSLYSANFSKSGSRNVLVNYEQSDKLQLGFRRHEIIFDTISQFPVSVTRFLWWISC